MARKRSLAGWSLWTPADVSGRGNGARGRNRERPYTSVLISEINVERRRMPTICQQFGSCWHGRVVRFRFPQEIR